MRRLAVAWFAVAVLGVGCAGPEPEPLVTEVPRGDPDRAHRVFREYGCSSCHAIPGVRNADGRIGPPLEDLWERRYIAGRLPNSPENLHRFIRDPQRVAPGTAMPNTGITEQEAWDAVAFLLSR